MKIRDVGEAILTGCRGALANLLRMRNIAHASTESPALLCLAMILKIQDDHRIS